MTIQEQEFIETVKRVRGIGYGRMMQIISNLWRDQDSIGALTVGETYGIEDLKRKRCRTEGHDTRKGGNWDWCDRCGAKIDPDTGKEARDL